MRNLYFLALTLFLTVTAFAQEEIDTDRPDQTETPSIVPEHRFQMENGFVHQQSQKHESDLLLPTALWKFGINKNLELRLETDIIYNKFQDNTQSGLNPVIVGLKVKLWDEKGILPQASLITQMQLPKLASTELKVDYLAPEIRLLFQNTLTENADLGYNLGINWDGESTDPIYAYTFSPNISITRKLKAYVEAYGFMPAHHHAEHWADGGFMFLITKDLQIDISAGYEITSANHYHQYYESLGVSFRI